MELFKAAKEAMEMRNKLRDLDEKLKSLIIGVDHKGIKIQVTAKNEYKSFEMPVDLLGERKEDMERLIMEAFNEASARAQTVMAEESKKLTAGLSGISGI